MSNDPIKDMHDAMLREANLARHHGQHGAADGWLALAKNLVPPDAPPARGVFRAIARVAVVKRHAQAAVKRGLDLFIGPIDAAAIAAHHTHQVGEAIARGTLTRTTIVRCDDDPTTDCTWDAWNDANECIEVDGRAEIGEILERDGFYDSGEQGAFARFTIRVVG
jgi:hypothetical protein